MKWHSDAWDGDIEVDHDKCTACGDCVDNCPVEVFELQNDKSVVVNIDECTECCVCTDCPEEAIKHSSC